MASEDISWSMIIRAIGVTASLALARSLQMPVMESLIADVVPLGRRTTALGFYFFLATETTGITTPIVGRLIDNSGLSAVFTTLAVGL